MKCKTVSPSRALSAESREYKRLLADISILLEQSRRAAARSINAVLTETYWRIGRRIIEREQQGSVRAEYGKEILTNLAKDLTSRFGRGFSQRNLYPMRSFYLGWEILQTPSAKFTARAVYPISLGASVLVKNKPLPEESGILQTVSAKLSFVSWREIFPLSWSHYVRLMTVEKPHARVFYENKAIQGGWSVRQLDRQIGTQFFERTSKSKRQAAMIRSGRSVSHEEMDSAKDEVRNPYLLEFLDLTDEYIETDLEDALIRHLESFLLELGAGFTFVARQKRIRVGSVWYRIDLLLYHRALRCLVVIDLKTGAFTHADAGQMNLYLNYVREHLTMPGEGDPIGIILCSDRDESVVKYATGGIKAKVFASQYLTVLPDPETLRNEIMATQKALDMHIAEYKERYGIKNAKGKQSKKF
jgi:predicted nuclease of restriction endonuclease-like (RecB) superfamily